MKFFPKTNSNNTFYNNLSSLTELANKLETDKGTADSSTLSWGKNWPDHSCMGYTLTYEKYMKHFRNKPVKLFEIGICDKRFPYASPKMWMSYFKDLDLYCVDNFWGSYLHTKIEDIKLLNEWGVNFIYADQGNFCDWDELKKECPSDFDFIVEDGSHWPNHMAVSLWQSRDMLKSGGYYFMEDLQNPKTSRGMFKYDNALLCEDLINTQKTGIFKSHFLNNQQNLDINKYFELVELVLDAKSINYLAIFRKI
jgi:hypothetical protein